MLITQKIRFLKSFGISINTANKWIDEKGLPYDGYYSMLFASVGNKVNPFNFSKIDFKLNDYNLANDTEKGIFFLECMDYCGKTIWGYMNVVKPPNTKRPLTSLKNIQNLTVLNIINLLT